MKHYREDNDEPCTCGCRLKRKKTTNGSVYFVCDDCRRKQIRAMNNKCRQRLASDPERKQRRDNYLREYRAKEDRKKHMRVYQSKREGGKAYADRILRGISMFDNTQD